MRISGFSRRQFLRASAACSAGFVLGTGSPARADERRATPGDSDVTRHYETRRENGFDPIHMYIHGIEDKYYRHWVLGRAAQVLHTSFRSIGVARNAYNIPSLRGRPAYFVDGDSLKNSNIEAHPTYGVSELLWWQLIILRLPNSAQDGDDEGPPFPPIHILPMYEENDVHGRAFVGLVNVRYVDANTARRTGSFEVQVNLRHLGSTDPRDTGTGLNANHWACVIGHEMLHNLGHKHQLNEYDDGRQINAFHRSLYCGGTYNGTQNVGHFGCHPTI
jgi:hypothetical protein